MNRALILAVLLLTGCASEMPVYRPVDVAMPVAVPCNIPVVDHPKWATETVDLNASLFDKVRAALVEIEQRGMYEGKLEAAIRACGSPDT